MEGRRRSACVVCEVYVGQCEWLRVKVGHSAARTGLTLFELNEQLPETKTLRTFVHCGSV